MEKKVRNLQLGDVLSSGAVVFEAPFDSVRCHKGKTNIGIEYISGERKIQQWNKDTIVKVK